MLRARAAVFRVARYALAAAAVAWALSSYGGVFVGGGSMAPALMRGDLVVYRRGAVGARVGAVVWVSKPGWKDGVLHRVKDELLDGRLVLRGDANPVADFEPASKSDIRGVVVFVLPTGRLGALVATLARMVQSRVT